MPERYRKIPFGKCKKKKTPVEFHSLAGFQNKTERKALAQEMVVLTSPGVTWNGDFLGPVNVEIYTPVMVVMSTTKNTETI